MAKHCRMKISRLENGMQQLNVMALLKLTKLNVSRILVLKVVDFS